MASVSISCPSCSATDGVVRNGKSTAGHQRYLCSHCRKTWQLQFTYTASQSGTWRRASGSTVLTGKIANGQQIPLPSGFSASQCTWSVSNAENPHGWKPNYFAGSVATYDANRIVKCGFYDEYNFYGGTHRTDLSGKCSYIVVCQ